MKKNNRSNNKNKIKIHVEENTLIRFIKIIKRYIDLTFISTILTLIIGSASLYIAYESFYQEKPITELNKEARINNIARLKEAEDIELHDSLPDITEIMKIGPLADECLRYMRLAVKYDFSFDKNNYSDSNQMCDDVTIIYNNMWILFNNFQTLLNHYKTAKDEVGYTQSHNFENYDVDERLLYHFGDDLTHFEEELNKIDRKNTNEDEVVEIHENLIRSMIFKNNRIEKMQEFALQIRKWAINKLIDLKYEPYVLVHPNETISIFPDTVILKKRHPIVEYDSTYFSVERWKSQKVIYDKQLEEYNKRKFDDNPCCIIHTNRNE